MRIMKTIDKNCKEEILELLRSTQREGIEDVIGDLEAWGFFTAPASAGHHLNTEGGLALHSLNTCKAALAVWEAMKAIEPSLEHEVKRDSIILASILHDVCKCEIYKRSVKKRKNALGIQVMAGRSRSREKAPSLQVANHILDTVTPSRTQQFQDFFSTLFITCFH